MDTLQLNHFLSIAETLHFGKSSRKCNLSPSAFTRSIKRLEDELGYPLLQRNNRHVELTPAGKLFRRYAAEILESLNSFQSSAAVDEKNPKGEISIFCTVTATYSILSPVIRKFRNSYPDINIKLQTGDASSTLQKVLDSEVDISITMKPDRLPGNICFYPIVETPLVFIGPGFDTRFLKKDEKKADLARSPLILPEKGLARERVDSRIALAGIRPQIYAQVSGNEAILAMVSLGCGIGLVPELVVKSSPLRNSIRVLEFDPPLEPYLVGLCLQKKKENNPLVKAFRSVALEEIDENCGGSTPEGE